MIIKLYTDYPNPEILHDVNREELFTAQEHTHIVEEEFAHKFLTKETLMQWYLSENYSKLRALGFLIDYLKKNNFDNIISFGSGPCVLEYLLLEALSHDINIWTTDFDSFFIRKSNEIFPDLKSVVFDFYKDNLLNLTESIDEKIEFGFSFGSFYTMDNPTFISFLKDCNKIGIERIIDFHAGYLPFAEKLNIIKWSLIKRMIPSAFRHNSMIRRLFGKQAVKPAGPIGKLHGYRRDLAELKKVYKSGGYRISKVFNMDPSYKAVIILHRV